MNGAKFLSLSCLTALCACGGGSGGSSSRIEGTWRGELIQQGGLTCADGVFLGVGAGAVLRTVTLEVSGGDAIGSPVTAVDGTCTLQGARTAAGFTAVPASGCYPSLAGVSFVIDSDDHATLDYDFDLALAPVVPGEVACVSPQSATLER